MKKIIVLAVILLLVAAAIPFSQNYLKNNRLPFSKTATAKIDNQTFRLYSTDSDKDKEVGLSNRNNMPQDYGMLFTFAAPDYYSFWMRDMKFPIDIIFIRDNRIVTIHSSVQPPKSKDDSLTIYKPEEPANAVLEINAGLTQKYGFKKGDEVKIEK